MFKVMENGLCHTNGHATRYNARDSIAELVKMLPIEDLPIRFDITNEKTGEYIEQICYSLTKEVNNGD